MLPEEGGFATMLQDTGIARRAQEIHPAAALRAKGYTPFFSRRLAETGCTFTYRGGGLFTAVSSKYMAEHRVFTFTKTVPGKGAALEIRTDKGGHTLTIVHGPQAGCSPLAGQAAFRADIQMNATARSLGWRHPVLIASNTNIYMDAATNFAAQYFLASWTAFGFQRATAAGVEDMTPRPHCPDTGWAASWSKSPSCHGPAGERLGSQHGAPPGGQIGAQPLQPHRGPSSPV